MKNVLRFTLLFASLALTCASSFAQPSDQGYGNNQGYGNQGYGNQGYGNNGGYPNQFPQKPVTPAAPVASPAPEPADFLLAAVGVAGVALLVRRKGR